MQNHHHLTRLIQANRAAENFNHNLVVDWAMALLNSGEQTSNLLMLASFGPPIDAFEIRPYIIAVLNDMGLEELEGDAAVVAIIRYYVTEIILGNAVRSNLETLYYLYNQYNDGFELLPFYLLHLEWYELQGMRFSTYYEGATRKNIETKVKEEAKSWLLNC